MVRFFKALILLPIAVIVVLIAVANRAPVQLSLDPFSQAAPEIAFSLPLFALVIAAVKVGVIIGGCGAWLAQGPAARPGRVRRAGAAVARLLYLSACASSAATRSTPR